MGDSWTHNPPVFALPDNIPGQIGVAVFVILDQSKSKVNCSGGANETFLRGCPGDRRRVRGAI